MIISIELIIKIKQISGEFSFIDRFYQSLQIQTKG